MDEAQDVTRPMPAPSNGSDPVPTVPAPDDEAQAEAALEEYDDGLMAAEVRAALEADPDGSDAAFAPALAAETARFGEATAARPLCQWCNAPLPVADAARCPSCKAILQPIDDVDVPGLTTVSAETRAAVRREDVIQRAAEDPRLLATLDPSVLTPPADVLGGPPSPDSYQPPSPEVREMMRRIKWEAFEADPVAIIDPGPLADGRPEEETL